MPIDRDKYSVVGTCGVCGGPVVIHTGPWQSRERVCRYCGVAPATPHIDKCQCPDCEPSKYPRKACDRGAFSPTERDALRESLRASLLRESQEKAWRLALEARVETLESERDTLEAERDRHEELSAENFTRAHVAGAKVQRLISRLEHPEDQR